VQSLTLADKLKSNQETLRSYFEAASQWKQTRKMSRSSSLGETSDTTEKNERLDKADVQSPEWKSASKEIGKSRPTDSLDDDSGSDYETDNNSVIF